MSNRRNVSFSAIALIVIIAFVAISSCQVINTGDSICQPPTFSPAGGTYTEAQSVTLATETSDAAIYYTTDGSVPTTASSLYTEAISVDRTTTIQAIAMKTNFANSTVSTASYVMTIPAFVSFGFPALSRSGTIEGSSVKVSVPVGTDLSNLVASFTTAAESTVSVNGAVQTSGLTPNNFSSAVTYRIAVSGGTYRDYTVTVGIEPTLTSFSFASPAVTGTISGTNISLTVPYNTDRTALVPTIAHSGISISPASGVARNFNNPVTYTVTAADGTTKDYTVTVRFGIEHWNNFTYALDGLGDGFIYNIDTYGTEIWVATYGGLSFSNDDGDTWTTHTGLGNDHIYDVIAVSHGTIYAATGGGLAYTTTAGSIWNTRTTANGLGNNNVKGIARIGSTIYVATWGGLSVSSDNTVFDNYTTANGLSTNNLLCVSAVNPGSGVIVYAGGGAGLSVSAPGSFTSWTTYTTANGLGSNMVLDVCVSGSAICAGTTGGLSVSTDNGASWDNYTTADGLSGNNVMKVFISGSTIFATTDFGLSVSTDGCATWTNYLNEDLGGTCSLSVYVDGSTVYLGTDTGGLFIGQ